MFTTDVGTNFSNMLDAAKQIDFHPIWTNTTTAYEQQFANWNVNGNGDDLYLGDVMVPLDYTPEGSANAMYVDLVTASGGDLSYSGSRPPRRSCCGPRPPTACGNELTRACLMDQLHGIHSLDRRWPPARAGPGRQHPGPLRPGDEADGHDLRAVGAGREGQFACDEKWLVKVDPPSTRRPP